MAEYLSVAEVVALHNQIMARMGEPFAPLRDEGLLESALMRAQTAAYYEGADIVRQASLLAIGISQNKPFVDGNKRTAFLALMTFIGLNGFWLSRGHHLELARQLERVATRSGTLDEATNIFESWLREHLTQKT